MDATQLIAGAGELLAVFRQPTWVAEQPERSWAPSPSVRDTCAMAT
jgi:hypothetical protein